MPRAGRILLLSIIGLAMLAIGAETASARIVCNGSFQIVNGQPVATPYCEDSYLAIVARDYGMQVSASAVRQSPGVKERVCRMIGHDNRARSACTPYLDLHMRRRF